MVKVIRIREQGNPSVMRVEDFDLRPLEFGEVRMSQTVVGVNYVDTMMRDGRFKIPLPAVLGFEAAGSVLDVASDVKTLKPGDRVGYFFTEGAYATERIIDAGNLIVLPDDITTEQAGALLAKGLTAWMGVRALHDVKPGETILVQGASGSVGAILSRWAKKLSVRVIGVAGSVSKLPKVQAGSDLALSSSDPEFLSKVKAVAPNGVDVVYDFVGDAVAHLSLAALREGGEIIAIGAASGQPAFDSDELSRKRIRVRGGSTPQFVNSATVGGASAELFEAIRSGAFDDLDVQRYAFDEVVRAHEDIARRAIQGLPVLVSKQQS